jgi:hypothetical protein
MGAEPADPQFENLPDLTGIDLTPAWDDADPAHLDDPLLDALLEPPAEEYDQDSADSYDTFDAVDTPDDFGDADSFDM